MKTHIKNQHLKKLKVKNREAITISWSYSGDPSTSDKDMVRFLIGDTDTLNQLVQDEEILATLVLQPNVYLAAAIIAGTLSAKFSTSVDVTVGKTSISNSQRAANYMNLAKLLRKQSNNEAAFKAIPYAGGISISDKQAVEDNSDRVKPKFVKGLFSNNDTTPIKISGDD